MNQQRLFLITTLFLCFILSGCVGQKKKTYVIGISQCSEDIWREKQNAELRMGAYFHDNVELCFTSAYDSDERQIQQIDSLVATGIDLLIVAPNQLTTINPAIDRAYDRGIPVIVFERKTNSQKYTAYIGTDNYEMGRTMGEYIATQLKGHGQVMEIMGLQGSSPAIERHNGFADALTAYPDIHIVATLQGDWTEESAYEATRQWLSNTQHPTSNTQIDYVFGQNDRMAIGARRALSTITQHPSPTTHSVDGTPVGNSSFFTLHSSFPKFCGIDGLPGQGGGIQLVRDSVLDASYIYPTHGDQLLDLAVDILEGKPFEREISLSSAIVTHDNANVLFMQSEEAIRQNSYIDRLHNRTNDYLQRLSTQRGVLLLSVGIIVLLLVAIALFYLYHQGKITLRRQRVVSTLWNMERTASPPPTSPEGEGETPTPIDYSKRKTYSSSPSGEAGGGLVGSVEAPFITRFKKAVESRLSESELSIEDLAADLNLSRVQLYRKVKAISGSSPVELLRTARLNRGYQLLLTTDKTISEVAYEVGFTAPSYFTKCFKDEFGINPSELSNPV